MSVAHMSADLRNPSFAKVAASIPTEKTLASLAGHTNFQSRDELARKKPLPSTSGHVDHLTKAIVSSQMTLSSTVQGRVVMDKVAVSFGNLNLGPDVPSLVVVGSNSAVADRSQVVFSTASGSDESQKADSCSELGTKPPSLDGKSITSGTTFALDEKESLRPDDSASVKASAEDDDSLSIRGSLVTGSRMDSDLATRARGIQLGDMPDRRLVQPAIGTPGHGILTPQSASSEQPSGMKSQTPLRSTGGSSDALNIIYRQAPDEQLLEALAAPRDRFFLLRLEKDVIGFVQDSKEPYMDLPPSNSFCRMLTHKLADYYHMTHSYEPHIGSVRIFRTPFCRVPPSLATMIPQDFPPTSSTPPPAVLPRKIMRRGQDDEGGVSAGASKATSETGSDKDKQPHANQKLSREEREEVYKLARQRIFGSSDDNPSETDGDYGMSRTSSVSANNKSSTSKRGKTGKQRRDDSDSFDSRRQYTPYWGPQQQTWLPQTQAQLMPPANGQFNVQPAPSYPAQATPVYSQQHAGYPMLPGMTTNASYPAYPMPQHAPQPAQQRYPPGGSLMTAYVSPSLPAAPPQNWQPGFNLPAYQARGPTPGGPPSQTGVPYAFGQLPAHINPNNPKSQHPIPGSYNRNHSFNPNSQSFVPGGNGMPPLVQPLQPPFTAPGSHHGSPQIAASHLSYGGYPPAMPHPYVGGYNMARQGSNNSIAAYHPSPPHITPHVPSMQKFPPPQHLPQIQPAHVPTRPNVPQGSNQMFSIHLPIYGNPATLPQKPATGVQ